MSSRIIAIDWSGALAGARRKIWLAEVADGALVRLENGRDRQEVADHLIALAEHDPQVVIGLDFAFSLPSWFMDERGVATAQDLWAAAGREAEIWLSPPRPPFWGRPGTRRPELPDHFRRTERDVAPVAGIRPKSVFQVGGAGAVGTGSLRGMRLLHCLHRSGFSIWPFDPPRFPLVLEIYPRSLTQAVVKSRPAARATYLAACYPHLRPDLSARATGSDDAFDAAVSALVMAAHADDPMALPSLTDPQLRREGMIWYPGCLVPLRS